MAIGNHVESIKIELNNLIYNFRENETIYDVMIQLFASFALNDSN